jgi:glutathione S-transferase
MITLFDNALSPFARKVRMVLEYKGLPFEAFDALAPGTRPRLAEVNPRVEVPVLKDGDLAVVNSSDIVAYLEHRYPQRPLYPADPALRAQAQGWERTADTLVDAILHDISYGGLGFPADSTPPGLIEAGRADLEKVYAEMEQVLEGRDFLCGDLSIADIAIFPHFPAARVLGVSFDAKKHPRLLAYYRRMRELEICRADLDRARAAMEAFLKDRPKVDRLVWRGDRIEWLLARGFHEWFFREIRAGRVAWPRRSDD